MSGFKKNKFSFSMTEPDSISKSTTKRKNLGTKDSFRSKNEVHTKKPNSNSFVNAKPEPVAIDPKIINSEISQKTTAKSQKNTEQKTSKNINWKNPPSIKVKCNKAAELRKAVLERQEKEKIDKEKNKLREKSKAKISSRINTNSSRKIPCTTKAASHFERIDKRSSICNSAVKSNKKIQQDEKTINSLSNSKEPLITKKEKTNTFFDEYKPIFTEDSLDLYKSVDPEDCLRSSNSKKRVEKKQVPDNTNQSSNKKHKNDTEESFYENFIQINDVANSESENIQKIESEILDTITLENSPQIQFDSEIQKSADKNETHCIDIYVNRELFSQNVKNQVELLKKDIGQNEENNVENVEVVEQSRAQDKILTEPSSEKKSYNVLKSPENFNNQSSDKKENKN